MKPTDSSSERTYLYWFIGGIVAGVLLAFPVMRLWQAERVQTVQIEPGDAGETRSIDSDVILVQVEGEAGHLKQGTRIWYKSDGVSEERSRLLLEWQNDESFNELFLPADDGTPAERKASVTLEKRE